jgi:hypothetical protein
VPWHRLFHSLEFFCAPNRKQGTAHLRLKSLRVQRYFGSTGAFEGGGGAVFCC